MYLLVVHDVNSRHDRSIDINIVHTKRIQLYWWYIQTLMKSKKCKREFYNQGWSK